MTRAIEQTRGDKQVIDIGSGFDPDILIVGDKNETGLEPCSRESEITSARISGMVVQSPSIVGEKCSSLNVPSIRDNLGDPEYFSSVVNPSKCSVVAAIDKILLEEEAEFLRECHGAVQSRCHRTERRIHRG